MELKIRSWGNSAGMTLPANLLRQTGMKIGDAVEVVQQGSSLLVTPAKKEPSLEELLEGTTRKDFELTADDRDWMDESPRGRELW